MITFIILAFLCYIIGSIPSALIIGKLFYNTDIRKVGSGNLGATNTFRVLGKKAGLTVFALDFLKGYLALTLSYLILADINYISIYGAFAMLGHIFPIFANFRGGKAVATGSSVLVFLYPALSLCLVFIFFAVIFLTGYVSLASITICLSAIIYLIFLGVGINKYVMIVMCSLVIYMHKKNILRIIKKEESKSKLKINFGGLNDKNN